MKISLRYFLLFLLYFSTGYLHAQEIQKDREQFSNIGDFTLESGEKIYGCSLGYRTYGKLNGDKSNVILFPTWFTGTTNDLENLVPCRLIDTAAFYVILVDALGDGLSSSPSNSQKQPRLSFPRFTIRDMVESQYLMLTGNFNIQHLYAIAGISMGGMQSFQWAVSHPDFADKIIPIVGSPQLTANDLLLWNGELQAMERDTAYHNGNYEGEPVLPAVTIIHNLAVSTPQYLSNTISRDSFEHWFMKVKATPGFDWNNWHRQLEAMIGHDIAKPVNGSLDQAAKMIRAKMLIICAKQDHMVNPIPAVKMAHLMHAKLLELQSDCGHRSPGCEFEKVSVAVHEFLSSKQ